LSLSLSTVAQATNPLRRIWRSGHADGEPPATLSCVLVSKSLAS
jgi:hypothetical protein